MSSNERIEKPIFESMSRLSNNSKSSDLGTLELLLNPFLKNAIDLTTPKQGVRISFNQILNILEAKVPVSDLN